MEVLQQMLQRAQANPQRIVLPEGDEPRTLEAANLILKDKIAELILVGNPAVIKQMAEEKGYEYQCRVNLRFRNRKILQGHWYGEEYSCTGYGDFC